MNQDFIFHQTLCCRCLGIPEMHSLQSSDYKSDYKHLKINNHSYHNSHPRKTHLIFAQILYFLCSVKPTYGANSFLGLYHCKFSKSEIADQNHLFLIGRILCHINRCEKSLSVVPLFLNNDRKIIDTSLDFWLFHPFLTNWYPTHR